MSSKLEKVVEFIINGEQEKADELLHEWIVEKARDIHRRLLENEEDPVLDKDDNEMNDEDTEGDGTDDSCVTPSELDRKLSDFKRDFEEELERLRQEFEKTIGSDDDELDDVDVEDDEGMEDEEDDVEIKNENDMNDDLLDDDDLELEDDSDDTDQDIEDAIDALDKALSDEERTMITDEIEDDEVKKYLDELDELDEAWIDNALERVKVASEDGIGIGTGGKFDSNTTSPVPQRDAEDRANRASPHPIKFKPHKGYEREPAPSYVENKVGKNARNRATLNPVPEKGDPSALVNKSEPGNNISPFTKKGR